MKDRILLDADIREPLFQYLEMYHGKVNRPMRATVQPAISESWETPEALKKDIHSG